MAVLYRLPDRLNVSVISALRLRAEKRRPRQLTVFGQVTAIGQPGSRSGHTTRPYDLVFVQGDMPPD